MTLLLTDEERMIADSASAFFADRAPLSQLRSLRDSRDKLGYVPAVWRDMAAMGFTGVLVPEAYGGAGLGYVSAGLIQEIIGRNLVRSPMLATSILGAAALNIAGNAEQRQEFLPKIAVGSWLIALASDEMPRHAPARITLRATRDDEEFILHGRKIFVLDGHIADQLIVVARSSGEEADQDGISLFLVDRKSPGIELNQRIVVDSGNVADILFDHVRVPSAALLGPLNDGYPVLEQVLNAGRACIAAEMLGIAEEVFSRTVEYLKQREQFGVKIGTFQALQHRAAHLFCELVLARSAVAGALRALDFPNEETSFLVSVAAAKTGQAARLATDEGVHMHGGIGMTDEFDIGLYTKRICLASTVFGDNAFHLDRLAREKFY